MVEAAIEGDYDGKETLELTSVNLDDGSVETVTVQEKICRRHKNGHVTRKRGHDYIEPC